MQIDIDYLVNFYDTNMPPLGVRQHSSAIKGVAGEELGVMLLLDFLHRQGWVPKLLLTGGPWGYKPSATFPSLQEIITPTSPKSKTPSSPPKVRTGKRLDAWIIATPPGGAQPFLFQVEVKSWSMHGYGSKQPPLPSTAPLGNQSVFANNRWNQTWNKGGQPGNIEANIAKVLDDMLPPQPPLAPTGIVFAPLLSMWQPLWPGGSFVPPVTSIESDVFFSIPISALSAVDGNQLVATAKKGVWTSPSDRSPDLFWFSQSAYLRYLLRRGTARLDIPLPDSFVRMMHLRNIFP